MSGIAYGIGAFLQGIPQGVDMRHKWDDRKRDQKRQDKADEYYYAEQDRAAKRFGWDESDRARADKERAAFEKANADAIAATEAAMAETGGGMGTSAAPPAAPVQPEAPPTAQEAAARAPQFGTSPDPAVAVMERTMPAAQLAAQTPQAQPFQDTGMGSSAAPLPGPRAPTPAMQDLSQAYQQAIQPPPQGQGGGAAQSGQAATPTPAAAPAGGGAATGTRDNDRGRIISLPNMPEDYLQQPNGRVYSTASGQEVTGRDKQDLLDMEAVFRDSNEGSARMNAAPGEAAAAVKDWAKPDYDHDFGVGLGPDLNQGAKRVAAAAGEVFQAADGRVVDANKQVLAVGQAVGDYVTGTPRAPAPATAPPPAGMGAAPPPATPAAALQEGPAGTRPGPLIANLPPDKQKLAIAASDAMADTATPAVKAATEAAQDNPDMPEMGAGGKEVTEDDREEGAKVFLEEYAKVGAPIVIEEMLRRGDVKGAMEFQEFLDTAATKRAMKSWGRAAFAAQIGDFDTFAEETFKAYDNLDYFGDNNKIDRENSGFIEDEAGNILGAKITIKDVDTGETKELVFDSPEDMVEMGIGLLAPETAFEYRKQQMEAAREARAGAEKPESQKEFNKRVDDLAKLLFEKAADAVITGGEPLSYEQARQQAVAALSGGGPVAPEAPALGTVNPGASAPAVPVLRPPGS